MVGEGAEELVSAWLRRNTGGRSGVERASERALFDDRIEATFRQTEAMYASYGYTPSTSLTKPWLAWQM